MNLCIRVLIAIVLSLGVIPYSYSQKLELISKTMDGDSSGGAAGLRVQGVDVSYDGRYIVYSSLSPKIVPGDTNKWGTGSDYYGPAPDVFWYDRMTKETIRVSLMPDGGELKSSANYQPSISADGSMIVYESEGSDFWGDKFQRRSWEGSDILAYDTKRKKSDLITAFPSGILYDDISYDPLISADGKQVVYRSNASNVFFNTAYHEIFLTNIATKDTQWVTVALDGKSGYQSGLYDTRTSLSADGRYVCFISNSTLLTPEGVGGVFVRDMVKGITELISISPDGKPMGGDFREAQISDDGRYILFSTNAVVPSGHPYGVYGAYGLCIRDREKSKTEIVPLWDYEGKNNSYLFYNYHAFGQNFTAFSATGRYVAFATGLFNNEVREWNSNLLNLYDRETGEIRKLLETDIQSSLAITPDGKTIVFTTGRRLLPEDKTGDYDIYALDIEDATSPVQDWSVR